MATGSSGVAALEAQKPPFVRSDILHAYYDGEADDLLAGGLGRSGLSELTVQNMLGFADAVRPTPSKLRRIALWNSHLGLIDRTEGSGYGRLYGPGAEPPGVVAGEVQGLGARVHGLRSSTGRRAG